MKAVVVGPSVAVTSGCAVVSPAASQVESA